MQKLLAPGAQRARAISVMGNKATVAYDVAEFNVCAVALVPANKKDARVERLGILV
jgi:hypothetical protein